MFIKFSSHRARDNCLRALGRKGDQSYYISFTSKRSEMHHQGIYDIPKEELEKIKDIKGWTRLRGPFDDLMKCWR